MSKRAPDVATLLKFHFECLQGMYFSEYIPGPEGPLLFSSTVSDPYYNFFAPEGSPESNAITKVAPQFERRGRGLAIYVTPLVDVTRLPGSWKNWATDAWMVGPVAEVIRSQRKDLRLREVGLARREEYMSVFDRAYSGEDPDDPYGQLDPGYHESLSVSFEHPVPGYQKYYVLAEVEGTPAGVAALFTNGDIAGVYGVGTVPELRGSGIGSAIMAHLTQLAASDGATHIMLQTEAGSKVESWYKDLGYTTVFRAEYRIPADN